MALLAACDNDGPALVVDPSTTATPSTVVPPSSTGGTTATTNPSSSIGNESSTTTIPLEGPLTLVIDGWSVASMDQKALSFTVGGVVAPVRLAPLSSLDLKRIGERDAEALTRLVARIAPFDPSLACTKDGCKGRRSYTLEQVANASFDGFDAMYKGYGINSGAYGAVLPAREGDLSYGSVSLHLTALSSNLNDAGENDPSIPIVEQTVKVVGSAFGQLFFTTPTWLRLNDPEMYDRAAGVEKADAEMVANLIEDPAVFMHGLSSTNPYAGSFNASQLTYRSSPSTGCGAGVLCVPGVVSPEVKVEEARKVNVCGANGESGTAVLSKFTTSYDYLAPTHQYGVWNGATPDNSLSTGSSPFFNSVPPLVSGKTTISNAFGIWVSGQRVVSVAGRITQPSVDPADAVSYKLSDGDLARLFGAGITAC